MDRTRPSHLRPAAQVVCPPWCVTPHGLVTGEDDWVHSGEPLPLADGVHALPCVSVDPGTGAADGPYVVIGWSQYTPAQAEELGAALIAMAHRVRRP